jgi:hypothetical protein
MLVEECFNPRQRVDEAMREIGMRYLADHDQQRDAMPNDGG